MKLTSAAVSVGNLLFGKTKTEADRFTELYNKHQKLVRSVIYQIAGDHQLNDLTQEAFIRIWKNRDDFRKEAEMSSWIYRISVNVAIDSLRQNKRRSEVTQFDFSSITDEKSDLEKNLADRELVQQGLNALHEEHRVVLVLALIHERPLKEIADILEISEGTVKSRLHYGKEHFRQFVAELSEKRK